MENVFLERHNKCNGLYAKPILMHNPAALIPYVFTQWCVLTECGANCIEGMNPFSGKMQLIVVNMTLVYAEQGRETSQLRAMVRTRVIDSQCDDLRLDSRKTLYFDFI